MRVLSLRYVKILYIIYKILWAILSDSYIYFLLEKGLQTQYFDNIAGITLSYLESAFSVSKLILLNSTEFNKVSTNVTRRHLNSTIKFWNLVDHWCSTYNKGVQLYTQCTVLKLDVPLLQQTWWILKFWCFL